MNSRQRRSILAGIGLILFMLFFPPYKYTIDNRFKGYYFIWSPPLEETSNLFDGAKSMSELKIRILSKAPRYVDFSVDLTKLAIQIAIASFITAGAFVYFIGHKKEPKPKAAKISISFKNAKKLAKREMPYIAGSFILIASIVLFQDIISIKFINWNLQRAKHEFSLLQTELDSARSTITMSNHPQSGLNDKIKILTWTTLALRNQIELLQNPANREIQKSKITRLLILIGLSIFFPLRICLFAIVGRLRRSKNNAAVET